MEFIGSLFGLIGGLGMFLYGMTVMSDGMQKAASSRMSKFLNLVTGNRVMAVVLGAAITALVQSSSATTVMVVGFVNAGILNLSQSVGIIMGANIGTTLTAWIMSLGYSVDLTSFVFPAFLIGIVLIYSRKMRYVGDFLFGLSFMFFSLVLLSDAGKALHLDTTPEVIEFFKSFDVNSYFTILAFLAIGSIITCIVQSSAAVMAITILLCSTGVLPIYLGIALVMGENIGTTITANLAALAANTQARRAALAHLMFNVIGVIWVLAVFYPFVNMVCGFVDYNPTVGAVNANIKVKLPVVLAAFHTTFNVANTFLLIWFIPQLEKLVCCIIKPRKSEAEEDFRLRFIQAGIMKTPELSVLEASKEIQSFAERLQRMFDMVRELLHTTEDSKFVKLYSRIEKYEGISDNMEIEIAKYLDQVSNAHLSDETKEKVRSMLREISELESIGDSCYNIARTINRKMSAKEDFTEKQYNHIEQMFELTDDALTQMNSLLISHKHQNDVNRSFNIENEINNYRNQLSTQNIQDVNEHKYTYAIGTMYMDIIQECEKLGDYVVNVVEARMGVKQNA